jgi:hypothetical protein
MPAFVPTPPANSLMGAGVLSRSEVAEAWSSTLTSTSVEVKNKWSYTSIPFTHLHDVDRNNFIF